MRYIQKKEEPNSLTEYRKNRNAYFDSFSGKDDIREALLKEQGYLCGYCMRRIKDKKETKIEHIVPQSTLKEDERQALDYKIMLGVCYGNCKKGRGAEALICDAHRGNKDLNVNPFDKRCIEAIKLLKLQKQGIWNKRILQQMLTYYESPNAEGELIPYSGIAIWYLKKKLGRM